MRYESYSSLTSSCTQICTAVHHIIYFLSGFLQSLYRDLLELKCIALAGEQKAGMKKRWQCCRVFLKPQVRGESLWSYRSQWFRVHIQIIGQTLTKFSSSSFVLKAGYLKQRDRLGSVRSCVKFCLAELSVKG